MISSLSSPKQRALTAHTHTLHPLEIDRAHADMLAITLVQLVIGIALGLLSLASKVASVRSSSFARLPWFSPH